MPPGSDLISGFCSSESQVPKRRSTHYDENQAKFPKLELPHKCIKSEADDEKPLKLKNIAHVLREQDLNVKQIKKENEVESLKVCHEKSLSEIEKKKKPKTPVQRVLVSLGADIGCGQALSNFLSKSHRKSSDPVAAFMYFVHERQRIYQLKSSGCSPPYTENEVMSCKWFTNMYRELDRGTMYFRKKILAKISLSPENFPEIVFKAIVYRLINKIETFEEFGKLPNIADWKTFQTFLSRKMNRGEVIFTSAHQNMGFNRFCETMKEVLKKIESFTKNIVAAESLQQCFFMLKSITNIGPFFAWQISCDFLELKLINFDENTWTCLGPGAKAGLRRIFTVKSDREELELAQKLTKIMDYGFKALNLEFPYFLGRKLTLKNIEHALCEYDKYFRAATKQPTRERVFQSRSCLDSCSCVECGKRFTDNNSNTKCVLCGSVFHQECLGSDWYNGLTEGNGWLCPKCHQVEFGDEQDDDRVFVYEHVKDQFKIRPVKVLIKQIAVE